jgi:hypothetical protein
VAVSWATAAAVSRPRLRLGRASFGHGLEVPAEGRTHTEALTGETVQTYHARLRGLHHDAGNHENEVGNGPQGYLSYQTRFELPDNGSDEFRGN